MVKRVYAVWVRIDETIPWIELKGKYTTKREAKNAAKETLNHAQVKVVDMPEKK